MKKIVVIICVIALFLALCGCNFLKPVKAASAEYIVTSMAFCEQKGEIQVFIEAIVVNTENTETAKLRKVFEGKGKTVEAAVEDAAHSLTQGLLFGHMAAIVFEESLSPQNFYGALQYCYSIEEITLSALCFSSDDAKSLIESEPLSSVAVGYDILSVLEQRQDEYGTNFKNKLYQVLSLSKETLQTVALPCFSAEDSLNFRGLSVYSSGKAVTLLENEQMNCYFIACDLQDKGKIFIDGILYEIESCSTKRFFEEGRLRISINIKGNSLPRASIQKYIEETFDDSKKSGYDVFGLFNTFYKQESDFKYDTLLKKYKNTSFKVVLK